MNAALAPSSPSSSAPTVIGLLAAGAAFGLGVIAFLIAGFEGHRAGWEMLAIPTGLSMLAGMVAGGAGIFALVRKAYAGGLATLGLAGFGVLLGLVGFALGA